MYKTLAIVNGMLLAISILSNGLFAEVTGNTPAIMFNRTIGLILILIIFYFKKNKWKSLSGIPIFYLGAGITGLATGYLMNTSFLAIGTTLTIMISIVGRLFTSTIIDHYGFFGRKKYPFQCKKLISLGLILLGIVLIILFN